uniref:Uncharacterized protein n=1 Tax=Nymphaea colorata TaxID=210225 RepID=A0A5K0VWF1_9MAGN
MDQDNILVHPPDPTVEHESKSDAGEMIQATTMDADDRPPQRSLQTDEVLAKKEDLRLNTHLQDDGSDEKEPPADS